MAKRKRNSTVVKTVAETKKEENVPLPLVRSSDEPVTKKV